MCVYRCFSLQLAAWALFFLGQSGISQVISDECHGRNAGCHGVPREPGTGRFETCEDVETVGTWWCTFGFWGIYFFPYIQADPSGLNPYFFAGQNLGSMVGFWSQQYPNFWGSCGMGIQPNKKGVSSEVVSIFAGESSELLQDPIDSFWPNAIAIFWGKFTSRVVSFLIF